MKRKHYPIVTVAIATLLTVTPLLLLSLSLNRSSTDSDIASVGSRDDNLRSSVTVQPTASKAPVSASTERKVTAVFADRSMTPAAPLTAEQLAAPARPESKQLSSRLPEVSVAIPSVAPLGNDVPEPADAVISDLSEIPLAPELVPAKFPQAGPVVADMGMIELPKQPDAGASYYEATGHLALRTKPQVLDSLASHTESPAPAMEPQRVADADEVASEKSRKSKSRSSKSEEKKSAEAVSDLVSSDPESPVDVPRTFIKAKADKDELVEEVVIQTPVESALVGRVENVVAMTRAKGWPIALIRSDLPDDVWWVQQVVGIQGNSFAARVNFGNEYSVSGSAFSMVIVFLDSPDEVRRFRIAKQFKDIPEGVRHSREFHYIRN